MAAAMAVNEHPHMGLPPAFVAWLEEQGVDPQIYFVKLKNRFIRVGRDAEPNTTLEVLREQLGPTVQPMDWLPTFYSLDAEVNICGAALYREGRIFGMDASSGAAIEALGIEAGDHVLDLCCAPGAKLCMMAERVGEGGSVTGVDVSLARLCTCRRSMVKKYNMRNVRLFLADARHFAVPPPQTGLRGDELALAPRPRKRKQGQSGPAALLGLPPGTEDGDAEARLLCVSTVFECRASAGRLYDKVLVDAECTHDGSLKHITKYDQWGWDTFQERFLNPDRLAGLQQLQRGLLQAGFRMLRPGGTLVYSTCSMARAQNEDIVAWFLASEPAAVLLPARLPGAPTTPSPPPLENAVKFDPLRSHTGALFIATMTRREEPPQPPNESVE
eukprot:m.30858 g.30858  ORF g.30858 m.30858 type:complete len:387 (+) comp9274_c0_seq2:1657-2817(+)